MLQVRDMEAALVVQVPWAEDLLRAELDRRRDEMRRSQGLRLGRFVGLGLSPLYLRRSRVALEA